MSLSARFRPAVCPVSGPQPQILLPLEYGSCYLGNFISPPPIIAGSKYVLTVLFAVHKGEGIGGKSWRWRGLLPWELRGRSEIIVFLADRPIKGLYMCRELLGRSNINTLIMHTP